MSGNPQKVGVSVTVGRENAEIVGETNRALQAAVDYVSAHGGGLVEIGEGTYTMYDSLHLRSGVTVRGQGSATLLRKSAASESRLALDGDFGEEQATLESPDGFDPGFGVSVTDDNSGGFHTVVATIRWRQGDTIGLSEGMRGDYLLSQNARAATTFPVVSATWQEDVVVENISIDGNKDANPLLNGCRGAGIYLLRGHRTAIRDCTIKDYHGDGISFQQSEDVVVENCCLSGVTHLGLHPGSGSQRPVIRNCRSHNNGQIGLFLCWRVKNGLFEGNELLDNGDTGISIGHKDTDNLFQRNTVQRNGREGILFRDESEPMGGHRNTFEDNEITDNGGPEEGYGVRVLGETNDLIFHRNRIGDNGSGRQRVAVFVGDKAGPVELKDNDYGGSETEVSSKNATLKEAEA